VDSRHGITNRNQSRLWNQTDWSSNSLLFAMCDLGKVGSHAELQCSISAALMGTKNLARYLRKDVDIRCQPDENITFYHVYIEVEGV
jgi:hypothetical protein